MIGIEMICRLCGNEKESKEFYRIKHFTRFYRRPIIWCRDCQRMFVEMKKNEKAIELQKEMAGSFCVKFE